MSRSLLLAGLFLGCGDAETPACDEGFVKKNGRWCVYEEAPLVIEGAPDPGPDPDPDPGTDDPTDTEDPVDPSDYVTETEEIVPLLTLSEVELGIKDAIETVRTIDPAPLHELYLDAQTDGDDECPSYDEEYSGEYPDRLYWRDACTVAAGASFSGYVYSYDFGSYIDSSETYDYAGYAYYNGSSKVVDGQGNTFIGAGYSSYYERTHISGGYSTFYNSISGNFRTDNPAYADTWLARDLNLSIYVYGHRYAEDTSGSIQDTVNVSYSASLSGLEGDINAVRLDDVYIYPESEGSMCDLEPAGLIALRDEAGSWYEVEFDGPKYSGAGAFPPDCDGCGRVYFRGQLLGEVCPDFSGIQTWDDRAWL